MATQPIEPMLLRELRARGIAKATISYSGGNDDGGCDGCQVVMKDGAEAALSPTWVGQSSGRYELDKDGGIIPRGEAIIHEWAPSTNAARANWYRIATAEERNDFELLTKLTRPVYARYGSFAGDFSCHGTLTYDVGDGELTVEAYETSYSSVDW